MESRKMQVCCLFFFVVWSGLYHVSGEQKSKSITTVIDTKWEAVPVIVEVAEFFAEEGSDMFWQFIDSISSLQLSLIELGTEKAMYDVALHEAGKLLSPAQVSVLKLALSLHVYSPRIEMYNQMAAQRGVSCPTAVDVAGTLICSSLRLESATDNILGLLRKRC